MKRFSVIHLIIYLLISCLAGCSDIKSTMSGHSSQNYISGATKNSSSALFDSDWRFLKADAPGAEIPDFDDTTWRLLDLPHDWSIEDLPQETISAPQVPTPAPSTGRRGRGRVNFTSVGPFSPQSPGGKDTGYTIGGTGWYRKHFVLDEDTFGKNVVIEFDGIYMNSDVWLNGHHLGNHPYGYTAFAYDLTDFLNPPGQENVLAVRVRNLGRNSRSSLS